MFDKILWTKPKTAIAALAAAGMMLASCATNSAYPPQVNAVITEVDALTVKACAFLPEEQAIEAILNANDPLLQLPQQIANVICASLNGTPSLSGARKFSIGGNPVIQLNGKPFIVHGTVTK